MAPTAPPTPAPIAPPTTSPTGPAARLPSYAPSCAPRTTPCAYPIEGMARSATASADAASRRAPFTLFIIMCPQPVPAPSRERLVDNAGVTREFHFHRR